eukprot:gene36231-43948_t
MSEEIRYPSSAVRFLERHAEWTINVLTPVLWAFALVLYVDRDDFLSLLHMPFLGFFAAFLANSVPIGGGIVYIPALSLLGSQVTLGTIFTLSIMPIGNGIFGFLNWLRKDSSLIIWDSFAYTVLPSWIGSFIAMSMLPTPEVFYVKYAFGFFCFLLGSLVLLSIYRGGLKNVIGVSFNAVPVAVMHTPTEKELSKLEEHTDLLIDVDNVDTNTTIASDEESKTSSSPSIEESYLAQRKPAAFQPDVNAWSLVILVSLLGGVVLVPNIGIGPALITYLMLVYIGYPDQAAIVTGIVTGGWVCVLPLALHYVTNPSVIPYKLVIMVLPGVYLGAKFAPKLVDWVGKTNVMYAFSLFLFFSALLMWFH